MWKGVLFPYGQLSRTFSDEGLLLIVVLRLCEIRRRLSQWSCSPAGRAQRGYPCSSLLPNPCLRHSPGHQHPPLLYTHSALPDSSPLPTVQPECNSDHMDSGSKPYCSPRLSPNGLPQFPGPILIWPLLLLPAFFPIIPLWGFYASLSLKLCSVSQTSLIPVFTQQIYMECLPPTRYWEYRGWTKQVKVTAVF